MLEHTPNPEGKGKTTEFLTGMAFTLDPDDAECLVQLKFTPFSAEAYKVEVHYPHSDETEDKPPEILGRYGPNAHQIGMLARFWGDLTGDEETVERLLEIHDDLLQEQKGAW